jgi:hypothetical protein
MSTMSKGAAFLAVVASLLSGCATTFQGSYLVGERYYRADAKSFPVIILSVDGKDTTMRRVLVDPGERVIRVQAPPVPGAAHETATLTLDVKPCFTYYIVAERDSRISAPFTPRVDYAEPIGGCKPGM